MLRLGASVPAVTIHILCTTHVQRRVTADALFYRATLRHGAVSVSVTSRRLGVLSKWKNESSSFHLSEKLVFGMGATYPTLCYNL